MEISPRFFPEQLAFVLEELEGKEGDGRALGWLRRKQRAFEEQGSMMFEKLEDRCEQIIFFRCERRCIVLLWNYPELQRAVAHPVIEGT